MIIRRKVYSPNRRSFGITIRRVRGVLSRGFPVYTWNAWYTDVMSEGSSESIRDVRGHLADVVDRADRDDEPTVITRRGKPVAAVVPIDFLRRYQEWEEREINRIVDERMSSRAAAVPMEDVIQETLARGE